MKKVLIAGANSYIGNSVKAYLDQFPELYCVEVLKTRGLKPSAEHFLSYDCVFCVAGIAHIKETAHTRHQYYEINRDLVIDLAQKAKEAGVRQFILLSTMSVYGLETGHILKSTRPSPVNAYGESKYQADVEIKKLESDNFKFACLRPPMVYGKNCKGNYQTLRKIAMKSPLFPDVSNKRSMIYIGNLCEFVKKCIDLELEGLFFPQNSEYANTTKLVRWIADIHGRTILTTKIFNGLLYLLNIKQIKKAFGDLTYELVDTVGKYGIYESISLSESEQG